MSKILFLMVDKEFDECDVIEQLDKLFIQFGWGAFYNRQYDEPFLCEFDTSHYLLISISDDCLYDNCDMLLLPDDCTFNNKTNSIPFSDRINQISCVLHTLLNLKDTVEMFVCESGTLFEELEHEKTNLHGFRCIAQKLNDPNSPDLHLTLTRSSDYSEFQSETL